MSHQEIEVLYLFKGSQRKINSFFICLIFVLHICTDPGVCVPEAQCQHCGHHQL